MKNYVFGWRKYETTFNGEPVSMEIRPLKSWAAFKMAPFMSIPVPRKEGESDLDYLKRLTPEQRQKQSEDSIEIQKLCAEIFPEHVRNLEGFNIDGATPDIKMLSSEMAFVNLVNVITAQLMSISSLDEVEEKNSDSPSGLPTSEDVTPDSLPGGQPGNG